jgi:hypothetical protein
MHREYVSGGRQAQFSSIYAQGHTKLWPSRLRRVLSPARTEFAAGTFKPKFVSGGGRLQLAARRRHPHAHHVQTHSERGEAIRRVEFPSRDVSGRDYPMGCARFEDPEGDLLPIGKHRKEPAQRNFGVLQRQFMKQLGPERER